MFVEENLTNGFAHFARYVFLYHKSKEYFPCHSVKECNKLIFALSASSCKCGLEGTQRIVGGEDSTVFCFRPYLCQSPNICKVLFFFSPPVHEPPFVSNVFCSSFSRRENIPGLWLSTLARQMAWARFWFWNILCTWSGQPEPGFDFQTFSLNILTILSGWLWGHSRCLYLGCHRCSLYQVSALQWKIEW